MKKKRKTIITFIIILVILIAVGGVFAYLQDTDTKTNIFTVGRVKIELTEPNFVEENAQDVRPGDEVNKNPQIKNIGTNAAYVYMKVEEPYIEQTNNSKSPLLTYDINTGWTLLGEKICEESNKITRVYYYNNALNSNTTTTSLFDKVTVANYKNEDAVGNTDIDMDITGYAIQSSYLPNGTTKESAYNTYFDNSGLSVCELPMLKPTFERDKSAFRSDTYKEKIKTITLDNKINEPANTIKSWDIGVDQNGNVMAYITENSDDNTMYDLYIQGKGALFANPDSSYLFAYLKGVDEIKGISKLNTTKVTNMSDMFCATGHDSQNFTLDLGDKFDTSNVTDMGGMFRYIGYNSPVFTLDLGDKFDTSNVTIMYNMFEGAGKNSTVFTLDLGDKFDTSKVTSSMVYMFSYTGYNSQLFTLNLGDKFDTSNVTSMHDMFSRTGYNSSVFNLDLGNKFDTSNVISMYGMFRYIGYNSPVFTLDLGDKFDTSKVTDMESTFSGAGYSSEVFTLNLGDKFDTSKVTNMESMFSNAGRNNTVFTLNLGDKFDTSNVTNMTSMFYRTGHNNSNFVLDLSTFNFSNVTEYEDIFDGMSTTKKIYVGNATARDWIINNSGNSALTTSNVLIKS